MIHGQRNCFCKIKLSKSLWSFLLSAKLESQRCISRKTNACTLTESMDTGQRPQKSWYYVNVSFSWYRCIVEDRWRQYIKEYKGSALHWIVDEEEQPQWKVGRDEGSREWNINVHERVRCPDLCKGHCKVRKSVAWFQTLHWKWVTGWKVEQEINICEILQPGSHHWLHLKSSLWQQLETQGQKSFEINAWLKYGQNIIEMSEQCKKSIQGHPDQGCAGRRTFLGFINFRGVRPAFCGAGLYVFLRELTEPRK